MISRAFGPARLTARDRLRDVGHVDVQAPVGQPPAEPLLHRRRAARRRRDVERLVVDAADRAVVDDAPRVGAEHAVADAPRLEVREAVGVQAVEERARVRARARASCRASRRRSARPSPAPPRPRPAGRRSRRRGASRPPSGSVAPSSRWRPWIAERFAGSIGRPASAPIGTGRPRRARGRHADVAHRHAGLPASTRIDGELGEAALRRAHRHRRVALGELDRVVALRDGMLDVLDRDVLVEVDERLAALLVVARVGGRRGDRRRRGQRREPRALVSSSRGRRRRCAAGRAPAAASAPAIAPDSSAASASSWPATAPAANTPSAERVGHEPRRWPRRSAPRAALQQQRRRRRGAAGDARAGRSRASLVAAGDRLSDVVDAGEHDAARRPCGPVARTTRHALRRAERRAPAARAVARRAASGPQVGDRRDSHPRLAQRERGVEAAVAGRRDDRGAARAHAVQRGQAARAAGEHDAGQVVVGEDERLLDRARRDDVPAARTWCSVSPCQTGTRPSKKPSAGARARISTPATRACSASARARSWPPSCEQRAARLRVLVARARRPRPPRRRASRRRGRRSRRR